MARPENTTPDELTALADGTLPARRRKRLEAELARSPELRAAFEQQQRAVDAIRTLEVVRAPDSLRARVDAERSGPSRRPARRAPARRFGFAAALAGATAAAALIVVLSLPGGAGGPSVVEAAELSELPPTEAAPQPAGDKLLDASLEGLPFPDWAAKFGWKATGERRDEIDGRTAVTVFYEKEGRTIAYTIISGEAIDPPDGSRSAVREGTRLRHFTEDGRTIVTWERDGKTCVLSGDGVPLGKLLELAAWKGLGSVPF
jgi:hypothetical protein